MTTVTVYYPKPRRNMVSTVVEAVSGTFRDWFILLDVFQRR